MQEEARKSLNETSPTDVIEMVLAELRARRKHLQQLMRLVNERVGPDNGAMRGTGAVASPPRHKCQRASGLRSITSRPSTAGAGRRRGIQLKSDQVSPT